MTVRCWLMAGGDKDYPEHGLAGVEPYVVSDQWYFVGRAWHPCASCCY